MGSRATRIQRGTTICHVGVQSRTLSTVPNTCPEAQINVDVPVSLKTSWGAWDLDDISRPEGSKPFSVPDKDAVSTCRSNSWQVTCRWGKVGVPCPDRDGPPTPRSTSSPWPVGQVSDVLPCGFTLRLTIHVQKGSTGIRRSSTLPVDSHGGTALRSRPVRTRFLVLQRG